MYLNAVMEIVGMSGELDQMPDVDFIQSFLPQCLEPLTLLRQGAADFYKMWDSGTLALDCERFFQRQVQSYQYD